MTQENPEILVDPTVTSGQSSVCFAYRSPDNILYLLGEDTLEDIESLEKDISISELLKKDPSLNQIQNIPSGYRAHRKNNDDEWNIAQLNKKTGQGDYIDGYLEWINKMYVDGYFTGGTVPHWYAYPGRPGLYGWVSLLTGAALLGLSLGVSFLNTGKIHEKAMGPVIFGVFFLGIGIVVLRKVKKDKKETK